ncbi:class I SAM-dependent methyltransferase [Nocardia panacis]|uniref:Class I SAM-dependent methyltransferase n=2 Tax=Nocardia panacis TaxID=2340916 RepID=A0A3A4KPJ5_9NOCA|nr:class I SAM-dependent methyltransferase [Nocardia panacis]
MTANLMAYKPFDRAIFAVFAELVGAGPVADIGCGPGRVTAHLAELGLDIFGIDLSPRMIELARERHRGLRFEVGSMERLSIGAAELAGLVAWYSIIHLPPERVPAVLAEFHRALRPGGFALLGGFCSEDSVRPYDHRVTTAYRWSPDLLARALTEAGFTEYARLTRRAEADERSPHMYLLVTKD